MMGSKMKKKTDFVRRVERFLALPRDYPDSEVWNLAADILALAVRTMDEKNPEAKIIQVVVQFARKDFFVKGNRP